MTEHHILFLLNRSSFSRAYGFLFQILSLSTVGLKSLLIKLISFSRKSILIKIRDLTVCRSIYLYVCVCLSGYTFPHALTDHANSDRRHILGKYRRKKITLTRKRKKSLVTRAFATNHANRFWCHFGRHAGEFQQIRTVRIYKILSVLTKIRFEPYLTKSWQYFGRHFFNWNNIV